MADLSTEGIGAQSQSSDPVDQSVGDAGTSAGWHQDPWWEDRLRWHDGHQWTSHTSPMAAPGGGVQPTESTPTVTASAGLPGRSGPGDSATLNRQRKGQVNTMALLLVLGAVAAIVVMGFMTAKTYRTDQRIAVLVHRGAAVQYTVSSCQTDQSNDFTSGDLTCTGSFTYQGVAYSEVLSGVLNSVNDGQTVPAVIDPSSPGSYVYIRTAVVGPNAAGRGAWYTGLILVLVLAGGMIVLAAVLVARQRRNEPIDD